MSEATRNDWGTQLLGELAEPRRGITYSSAMLESHDEGLPYVNMKSFLKGGGFNSDGTKRYAGNYSPNDLVGEHDLLIANTDVTSGDIVGVPALLPEELSAYKVLYSHHVTRLRLTSGVTVPFLYYLLCLPEYRSHMLRIARGTTVLMLDMHAIKRIPIRAPKAKVEQDRIAEILSTLDEAIEQTEALIATHQQIKAGLMHDLFTRGVTPDGHLRPTHEQASDLYKESPLGWIPKEWEVQRLGGILRRCGGYLQTGPFGSQLHAHEYQVDGIPVVMPQDINDGLIGTEQIARIHESRAEELARHRMRLGDIVIARRGDLSRAAAINASEQGWVCGTGCFLLRLGQSALRPDYASYVYRQNFIQRQIAATAVGTTMPSLNNSVMEALFFPFCGEDEQSRIVECLKGVEQDIEIHAECLFANRQLKQGLMHDLLTGHVRVKV